MGKRKRESAELIKQAKKQVSFAKLKNVPSSPRKMRLVADMIRGVEVNRALGLLKFSNKEAAAKVEKLLRSAIANWEQKNERKPIRDVQCQSLPFRVRCKKDYSKEFRACQSPAFLVPRFYPKTNRRPLYFKKTIPIS